MDGTTKVCHACRISSQKEWNAHPRYMQHINQSTYQDDIKRRNIVGKTQIMLQRQVCQSDGHVPLLASRAPGVHLGTAGKMDRREGWMG